MKYKNIYVVNFCKVGSHVFYDNLVNNKTLNVDHFHNLDKLEYLLNNDNKQTLLITGIREFISRNNSYFFQHITDNYINGCNENVYIDTKENIEKMEIYELIHFFNKKINKKLPEEWLDKYFNILNLNINNIYFNKNIGYTLITSNKYKNCDILLYTLEKLTNNFLIFEKILNTKNLKNTFSNNSDKKWYKKIYEEFKLKYPYSNGYIYSSLNNKYMDKFYDIEFINKRINYYKTLINKKEKIWIYWNTGINNAPNIIKLCINTWKYYNNNWNIIILDDNNLNNYIDIYNIIKNKNITIEAKSDIIRICILYNYGGLWVDSTVICTKPLYKWFNTELDFFAYSRPGEDRMIASWFLYSKKNNYIIEKYYENVIDYWKNNSCVKEYFWLHYLFEKIYNNDNNFKLLWDKTKKIYSNNPLKLCWSDLKSTNLNKENLDDIYNHTTELFKLDWRVNINIPNSYINTIYKYYSTLLE